jgi:hypothetical protein
MNNLLSYTKEDLEQLLQDSRLKVSVEIISPDSAKQYLTRNFETNRKLSPKNVAKHISSMQKGAWLISTDCIGFDTSGRLINGQHRLTALVQSQTSQPFIVVRNLPIQAAQVLDLGKKRMMDERLCIAGKNVSRILCSVVRNTMTTYTENYVGTVKFTEQHDDNVVYSIFEKHSQFFNLLEQQNLCKPAFFAAAAAKMYAEMRYYNTKRGLPPTAAIFPHGMEPGLRAIHFVNLALHGGSEMAPTDFTFDTAAIRLKELRDTRRAQHKHWNTITEYRLTVSAAYAFMVGKPVKVIRPVQKDPFLSFITLPSTNIN